MAVSRLKFLLKYCSGLNKEIGETLVIISNRDRIWINGSN